MQDLEGIKLSNLPSLELRRVRDLAYFDGPLLVEFKNQHGDHYLSYWCDCGGELNRWMLFRVKVVNILRLVQQAVPLDYIIPAACQDGFVYFVDRNDLGKIGAVFITPVTSIPEEYVPEKGVYLQVESDKRESSKNSFSLLMEGNWPAVEVAEFPNKFSQVYSLLYTLNVLQVPQVGNYPWRGGFSAMHFFREISGDIPDEHRLRIGQIQYASPGFIQFSLHQQTGYQVAACVSIFERLEPILRDRFRALDAYIRQNNLNQYEDPWAPELKDHDQQLTELTGDLLRNIEIIDTDQFLNSCPRPFVAAKISMAFYRRVRTLRSFEDQGLLRFPRIENMG